MVLGRVGALGLWLSVIGWTQPSMTTIQDTLYKADGSRLNGTAVVNWAGFEAGDTSNIVQQSLTIPIIDGNLWVRLVPSSTATPATVYTVSYSSDGNQQFVETWSVPASTTTLRVRDVRTGSTTTNSPTPPGPTAPGGQSPILESNIVGLVSDLELRPVKGPGFGLGRTAIVNSSGGIETVVGNSSDCVHVDGTSGLCFDPTLLPSYFDGETPGGIVDGSNTSFTLANAPSPVSALSLYRNGIMLKPGSDYNLTGSSIQFLSGATPQPQDTLLASYRLTAPGALGGLLGGPPAPVHSTTPQVLCSSAGSSTTGTAALSLGSCTIPGNLFAPGDRVEIRFSLAHQGNSSTSEFFVYWGATVLVHRTPGTSDALIAGRAEAAVGTTGVQFDVETWGTLLAFLPGLGNAADPLSVPLKIDFQADLARAGSDSLALVNYTVLRYPAISHP